MAAASDDGGTVALTLWGWKDEVLREKKAGRNFTYDVKELCRFSADGKKA